MGNTYTVSIWGMFDHKNADYEYKVYWRGESFFGAIWYLIRAKHEGYGCVKLEWR